MVSTHLSASPFVTIIAVDDFKAIHEQVKKLSGGMGQRELEQFLGIKTYDVQNALAGTVAAKARYLEAAREKFNMPKEWPDGGLVPIVFPSRRKIRIIGSAGAGEGVGDHPEEMEVDMAMPSGADFGFIVRGDSLMPYVHPGDLLAARPEKRFIYNKLMLIRWPDQSISAKTVVWKDGRTQFRSENGYEDIDGGADPVGLVIGVFDLQGGDSFGWIQSSGVEVRRVPIRKADEK